MELALLGGGAAGNDPDDLDQPLVFAEQGADALQRAAHLDVEVLLGGRCHVVGVRVEGPGHRVEIAVVVVLPALLHQPGEGAMGARADLLDRLRDFLPMPGRGNVDDGLRVVLAFGVEGVEIAVENLHFQRQPPPFPQRRRIGRVVELLRFHLEVLLPLPVEAGVEDRVHHPLDHADTVVEQLPAGIGQDELAPFEFIVDMGGKGSELLHVGLEEKALARVELAQIEVEHLARQIVVQRRVAEMLGWQLLAEDEGDQPVAVRIEFGWWSGLGQAAASGRQQERAGQDKAEDRTTHESLNRVEERDGCGPPEMVAGDGTGPGRTQAPRICDRDAAGHRAGTPWHR